MRAIKNNYLYVDGLRALAAIYVLIHHITRYNYSGLDTLARFIQTFFQYGHYAVDVFIVISGFCLMLPVLNNNYHFPKGVLNFYKRRFKRIYPVYFIACLLSLGLIYTVIGKSTGTMWDLSLPVTPTAIITHLFLIQDFFYSTIFKVNFILWSVAVEGRIYILFPLLVWCCRKWSVPITFIISCLISFSIWVVLMFLYKKNPDIAVGFVGVHPYIILFCSGMLAAYLSFKENRLKLPWVAILLGFISIQILLEFNNRGISVKDVNIGFCAMSLLIAIEKSRDSSFNIRWIEKVVSGKYLVFFGIYAYSIYLFHPLILQLFYQLMIKTAITQVTLFYLFLTIGAMLALAICYGMFLLFEKPFLNRRNIIQATVTEPAP